MMNAPSCETYSALRRHYVLVEYCDGLLTALLRLDEPAETRELLRGLGFEPNASPKTNAVSWRRNTPAPELESVCRALHTALGDAVAFDVGSTFDLHGADVHPRLPEHWLGRFVLEVGGTRRSVVFEAAIDERAIAHAIDRGRSDYETSDFRPATE